MKEDRPVTSASHLSSGRADSGNAESSPSLCVLRVLPCASTGSCHKATPCQGCPRVAVGPPAVSDEADPTNDPHRLPLIPHRPHGPRSSAQHPGDVGRCVSLMAVFIQAESDTDHLSGDEAEGSTTTTEESDDDDDDPVGRSIWRSETIPRSAYHQRDELDLPASAYGPDGAVRAEWLPDYADSSSSASAEPPCLRRAEGFTRFVSSRS